MFWLVDLIVKVLIGVIVARAVLSFIVPLAGNNPHPLLISITSLVNQVTEPVLAPLRRVLPTIGMFDFSPMVAIVILLLIRAVVAKGF